MSSRHAVGGMVGAADDGMPHGSSLASNLPSDGSGARRIEAPSAARTVPDEVDLLLARAKPVARGATSQVFRVAHPRLGCDVAIKVLDERHRDESGLHARLQREARAVASVRDAGVVRVLDLRVLQDGRPALLSEWLDGEDLERCLRRVRTVPLVEALAIARDVSLALAAAHERGVLHRDVKPANVFLVDPLRYGRSAILLDFGVARCAGEASETATGGLLGTPAYMAPEQARDATSVDARADVYSTCALLFRMLSGEPPYEPGDPWTTLQRLSTNAPRSLAALAPHLPTSVVELVERGLSRDPSLRPASARSLATALDALVRSQTPQPLPAYGRSERHASRIRPYLSVVAATTTFVGSIASMASGALAHPLRSEGLVLLVIVAATALGVALTYLDRERQRSGGPRSAIDRLDRLSRSALRGFAEASASALLLTGLLQAFDVSTRSSTNLLTTIGLLGLLARLALVRARENRR